MASVAETVRWEIDLSECELIPGLAWGSLDIVVEVAIAERGGGEACRLVLDTTNDDANSTDAATGIKLAHDREHVVVVTIPPRSLDTGSYRLQGRVQRDGDWEAIPEEPDRLYLRDAVV